MSQRSLWWLLGTVLVVSLIAVLVLGVGKPSEQTSEAPTSYSPLPHGTKAFYMTLERLGYKARRWRMEFSRLAREKGVLILAPADPLSAGGRRKPLSLSDANEIARWLERGNAVLYFLNPTERERGRSVLLERLDLILQFEHLPADHRRTQTFRQFLPTRLERDMDYILPVPWAADVRRLSSDAVPAFSASMGTPVVLADNFPFGHVYLVPYGAGRLYLFSSSGFMDNHFIAKADNLTFLLNILDRELARGGSVLFDEFHHGFSSEFSAVQFSRLPVVRFAALQGAFLLALYLVTSWQRFGRPVPLLRDTRRSIREYMQSLGNLYYRARTHRETLEYLFTELRRGLCSRYNLPDAAPTELLTDKLRVQRGAAEAWRSVVRDCDRLLARRRVAGGDLLAVSRKMEEFRKLIA